MSPGKFKCEPETTILQLLRFKILLLLFVFFFSCEQVKDSDEPESKKSKGSSSPGAEENTEEDETLELDEHPEEVRSVFHAVFDLVYLTPFAWFISWVSYLACLGKCDNSCLVYNNFFSGSCCLIYLQNISRTMCAKTLTDLFSTDSFSLLSVWEGLANL